ncbi:MAG TPA: hypothetical protein VFF08_10410, partial [Trueperaceae bacterium]|nr:hypothetical protein [Trueperaceae bacterium]
MTTTREPLTEAVTGRLLGLPSVARLALFARHQGPAVLLTTSDRLELFVDAPAFGAGVTVEPGPADWHALNDKVVVSLDRALSPMPPDPRALALRLEVGRDYPREELLEALVRLGFERDAAPGFTVRGDTVTVHLAEDDAEGGLRLEFFGDELEALTLRGEARPDHVLAPVSLAEYDRSSWTTRLLEHLPGTVFLDAPELMPGAVDDAAAARPGDGQGGATAAPRPGDGASTDVLGSAWLWGYLAGRDVVSFGRDPLDLERASAPLEPLGYYRGKLTTFAQDVHMWLRDGYAVHLLLRFERTGRYLREKVLDEHESHWRNEVGERPGQVSLLLAKGAQGGYRD